MRPNAKIFTLLRDHAGKDLDAVLSDREYRPLMDQIGALASQGERLYPSETSVREAWLRLAILSREQSKRETPDYDRKDVSAVGDPTSQTGPALRLRRSLKRRAPNRIIHSCNIPL